MSDHPKATITRRGLLIGAGTCAALALSASKLMAQTPPPLPLDKYQRAYFNAEEWAFIIAATARLIPSEGNGPGALEARVPVYIDKQMSTSWALGQDWYMQEPFNKDAPGYTGYQAALSPANAYRAAIPQINRWCQDQYSSAFADLSPAEQDEVLKALEADKVPLSELHARDFFSFLLQNTKEGYLADPKYGGNDKMAAWIYIGFPGARASFLEWVEKDNVKYKLGPVSLDGERG